jgi:GDP-4-dehydro-6-deoxy-D-mannose reductase
MPRTALITGIGGFVGSHLSECLIEAGLTVQGIIRPSTALANISHLITRVKLHACDVRSLQDTAELLKKTKPDLVFHLAAISSVPEGERNQELVLQTNLMGTLNILEAVRRESPAARFILISSPEVYGRVNSEDNPVKEDQPVRPIHQYGVSKALAEQVTLFYHLTWGLSVVLLRPFNHIGPRQADSFVCSDFSRQVALIDLGRTEPVIRVGDLSPVRDFTDVRDVVRAYLLAAETCTPGRPYHIASGTGVRIKEILTTILSFTDIRVDVRQDPTRLRQVEIPVIIGDASRLVNETGWKRRYSLSRSLQDTFQYWKERARFETRA